ncbi:MAG: penicillin-binding transpeptidase domain-containing protein, partial [Armatimonadota bacterium]
MDFRPNVRKLAVALLCGFLLLLAQLTYWQVVVSSRLQASPYNERPRARRAATRRGSIFDRNGLVLARTEEFGDRVRERIYPLDDAAAHVVGYLARVHGSDGIERTQDDALMATGAYRTSFKRLFSPRGVGCDVTLTLDGEAQRATHEELALRRGAAVAIAPRTGEILVMASAPSFSPALVDEDWEGIVERSDAPLLNRAAAQLYQVDAGLHLAVVTAAIDAGVVRPAETFRCAGRAEVGGVPVECGARRGHGRVSVSDALALPCKIALATLAARAPPETVNAHVDGLGLRDAPDIELAARLSAVGLPLSARPADVIAWLSDGGEGTTPLVMCAAVAAIANQGMRMRPYLVETVADVNGRVVDSTTFQQLERACSAVTAREVAALMTDAPQRGTAEGAGIADMQVAGIAGSGPQPDG